MGGRHERLHQRASPAKLELPVGDFPTVCWRIIRALAGWRSSSTSTAGNDSICVGRVHAIYGSFSGILTGSQLQVLHQRPSTAALRGHVIPTLQAAQLIEGSGGIATGRMVRPSAPAARVAMSNLRLGVRAAWHYAPSGPW